MFRSQCPKKWSLDSYGARNNRAYIFEMMKHFRKITQLLKIKFLSKEIHKKKRISKFLKIFFITYIILIC